MAAAEASAAAEEAAIAPEAAAPESAAAASEAAASEAAGASGFLQAPTERAATAAPATRILRSVSEVIVPGPSRRFMRRTANPSARRRFQDLRRIGAPTCAEVEYAFICEKGKHQLHDTVIAVKP